MHANLHIHSAVLWKSRQTITVPQHQLIAALKCNYPSHPYHDYIAGYLWVEMKKQKVAVPIIWWLFLTFCQISSNCSTPSATFFRHRSISPGGDQKRAKSSYKACQICISGLIQRSCISRSKPKHMISSSKSFHKRWEEQLKSTSINNNGFITSEHHWLLFLVKLTCV